MITRILEGHGKKLQLDIEWRPLYEILASYLDGEANGYNGAIPIAVHQAVICRLAQKARRHFSADAPAEKAKWPLRVASSKATSVINIAFAFAHRRMRPASAVFGRCPPFGLARKHTNKQCNCDGRRASRSTMSRRRATAVAA